MVPGGTTYIRHQECPLDCHPLVTMVCPTHTIPSRYARFVDLRLEKDDVTFSSCQPVDNGFKLLTMRFLLSAGCRVALFWRTTVTIVIGRNGG